MRIKPTIEEHDLISFCKKFDEMWIYGKGVNGKRVYRYLSKLGIEISGFVVSDNYFEEDINTLNISTFADKVKDTNNYGLIIAVNDKHYLLIIDSIIRNNLDPRNCFLISDKLKRKMEEDEKSNNEKGKAKSISSYVDFFSDVYKHFIPGRLNLLCHQHMGDTCILMGLKSEIENFYEKEINYIIRESQDCIPQLYGIVNYESLRFETFFNNDDTEGFSEMELEFFRSDMMEKMFTNLPQTLAPFVTAPYSWNNRWDGNWKTVTNSRARMLGMDVTKIYPPNMMIPCTEKIRCFIHNGDSWDNIVLIAPEARANPQIPVDYWKKIVNMLKKEGYIIVCNTMRKENKLDGTVDLDLSITDLIALGQRCHAIYSTRSGLCDCLASRGSALHVYYPTNLEREFDYYSLNNNFILDDPVDEVIVGV